MTDIEKALTESTETAQDSVDLRMPFGKYRGYRVGDLPVGYLRWLAQSGSCPEEIREMVQKTLNSPKVKAPTSASEERQVPVAASDDDDGKITPQDNSPRQVFRISSDGKFAKINGTIIQVSEIRSILVVRTPVVTSDCILTHVCNLKEGCLGNSNRSLVKLWLTGSEAAILEDLLFEGRKS